MSTEPDEPAGSVTKNVNSRLDDQLAGESGCHGVSLTGDVRSTGNPGLDATVLKSMGENRLGGTVSRERGDGGGTGGADGAGLAGRADGGAGAGGGAWLGLGIIFRGRAKTQGQDKHHVSVRFKVLVRVRFRVKLRVRFFCGVA